MRIFLAASLIVRAAGGMRFRFGLSVCRIPTKTVLFVRTLVAVFAAPVFTKIRIYLWPNRPAECSGSNTKKFFNDRKIIFT